MMYQQIARFQWVFDEIYFSMAKSPSLLAVHPCLYCLNHHIVIELNHRWRLLNSAYLLAKSSKSHFFLVGGFTPSETLLVSCSPYSQYMEK